VAGCEIGKFEKLPTCHRIWNIRFFFFPFLSWLPSPVRLSSTPSSHPRALHARSTATSSGRGAQAGEPPAAAAPSRQGSDKHGSLFSERGRELNGEDCIGHMGPFNNFLKPQLSNQAAFGFLTAYTSRQLYCKCNQAFCGFWH
jgi:hypothetical protein